MLGTPDCPAGYKTARVKLGSGDRPLTLIIHYVLDDLDNVDTWNIYVKGTDVDICELVVGNDQLCKQCENAIMAP